MDNKSILELIRENLRVDGTLPPEIELPEISGESQYKEAGLQFALGAQDGIYLFHMPHEEISDENSALLADAVWAIATDEFDKADAVFEELTKNTLAITFFDDLRDLIYKNGDNIGMHAFNYAVRTLRTTQNKELYKFALTIISMYRLQEKDRQLAEDILISGVCDEFSFFVLQAVLEWKNSNDAVFEIARKARGWGRVHAMAFLDPSTEEIRRWVLKEGVHNEVLPDYTAFYAWEKSGAMQMLDGRLTAEDFASIREIMGALLSEGPVLGISIIKNPDIAVRRFLDQARFFKLGHEDYRVISDIRVRYENEEHRDDLIVKLCKDLINGM